MVVATTSIITPGIKDTTKLVEILLSRRGVRNVTIIGNRVNVTYEPSVTPGWLIHELVKENSVFLSKG
ncbi:MAG: hypothetical protein AB1510_03720 [Bacillota bacterium]